MGGVAVNERSRRSPLSPVTWILATLFGPSERHCGSVILFRALWATLFIVGLHATISLGTSPILLAATSWLGISLATHAAHSRLRTQGALIILGAGWCLYSILTWGLAYGIGTSPGRFFTINNFDFHSSLALLFLTLAAVTTWFFWRVRSAVTIEAVVLAGVCILVFAGHRGFHFNRPKIVNTLAWQLRVDHLTMLLIIGAVLLTLSALYVAFANKAVRPLAGEGETVRATTGSNLPLASLLIAALLGVVVAIQYQLYTYFSASMLARVSNGVGMESSPGVSPLTFQSALGSTNQPSALVRLEGDYANNPYSPMLYLRENALSAFTGQEMVNAGRAYDADVPNTNVNDSYTGKEDPELFQRTPVVHSVYPLADHKTVFAVDYPLSIVQLKNPKPNRFKASYRAYSVAPGFKQEEIEGAPVGDPRWSEEVRQHYLVPHPDIRYKELAEKVTAEAITPVQKVLAITSHLNKTAIYTLSPNHEVKQNEDQVAPFLFGDHRGYCVHFAHAVVYMARAIGIPARIGTGYLTDLSQSKDGHILLLMSDRHAWAEVYVQNYGWLPFDVQPEQVESHADNKVDAKLLEELMGMIDPGEELLPDEIAKDEPGMEEVRNFELPSVTSLVSCAALAFALFGLLKSWLIFGWRFSRDPKKRAHRAYVSAAACFEDIGCRREYGETRTEFSTRIPDRSLESLTSLLLRRSYGNPQRGTIQNQDVNDAYMPVAQSLKALPWWKRLLGVLNPASVLTWLSGGRW